MVVLESEQSPLLYGTGTIFILKLTDAWFRKSFGFFTVPLTSYRFSFVCVTCDGFIKQN